MNTDGVNLEKMVWFLRGLLMVVGLVSLLAFYCLVKGWSELKMIWREISSKNEKGG